MRSEVCLKSYFENCIDTFAGKVPRMPFFLVILVQDVNVMEWLTRVKTEVLEVNTPSIRKTSCELRDEFAPDRPPVPLVITTEMDKLGKKTFLENEIFVIVNCYEEFGISIPHDEVPLFLGMLIYLMLRPIYLPFSCAALDGHRRPT
ncbi:hypothetical protein K0M31_002738 [Melipona bicolor]|uniref:Uncharacterized protein n=1 Tax=Melipona bicolor TaxID=60889 RepID=A0AA40FZT3_9HYME|nr:hypothetical protein K0M31_002738 [Melipona bicolor]